MQQMPRSNSLAEGKKDSKQGGRRIGKRERESENGNFRETKSHAKKGNVIIFFSPVNNILV